MNTDQPDSPKHPGGRPRVQVDPQEIIRQHEQGASWREIGKPLGIGPATAIRLFKASQGLCSKTHDKRSKTPEEVE